MSKTTIVLTEKELKDAIKGVHGLAREIATLKKRVKAGTLDRNRLESGLKILSGNLRRIPPHPCR